MSDSLLLRPSLILISRCDVFIQPVSVGSDRSHKIHNLSHYVAVNNTAIFCAGTSQCGCSLTEQLLCQQYLAPSGTSVAMLRLLFNCVNHQLNAQFLYSFLITSVTLHSSTCFEHRCAHSQEERELYVYSICYRHTL